MEVVKTIDQIDDLKDNKIMGNPKLDNVTISFAGKGNILYCENNVKLSNCRITFWGENSLVYLSSSDSPYPLSLDIFKNSTFYIGKDAILVRTTYINVQEHKNIIIGDDCSFASNVSIRTSDPHIIYDSNTKKRVNHSYSTYIGDHVWLGHQAYVGKGVKIGSGAILDNNSYASSYSVLKSNTLYGGNPVNVIQNDVFFTKDYTGSLRKEDSADVEEYKSRIFLFSNTPGETLDFDKIDSIISNFNVNEKLNFIQKLFIQNKKHNRFAI